MYQFPLLCYRDTGWITIPSCLGSVHYWSRWVHSGRGERLVQIPLQWQEKQFWAHSLQRLGQQLNFISVWHVSLVDRCLMIVLCNVNKDEEKTHFKTIQQLSKTGNFKIVRFMNNTSSSSNISSWIFGGLNCIY